jgi:RNA 2',3'-cyclic 3'-phosphodiesterase
MTIRTFLAVALSDAAREALQREISSLAKALPSVRWGNVASLHLTLAFLGELDDERLAAAHEATQAAASQGAPFALTLDQLGTFGPSHAPRVIWAGVGGEVAALRRVQTTLAHELDARGFPPQEHPDYAPHLTLARVRDRLPAPELVALQQRVGTRLAHTATWTVTRLDVMRSELVRPAARYTTLASYPLGG